MQKNKQATQLIEKVQKEVLLTTDFSSIVEDLKS
jgi:hypothetical protein